MSAGEAHVTTRSRWLKAPTSTRPAARSSVVAGLMLVLWAGVAGPLVRASNVSTSQPVHVLLVGSIAAGALVATAEVRWWARLLVASACVALIGPQDGTIAAWMAVGLLLGTWVGFAAPPLPWVRADVRRATAPVIVLTGVATWQGIDGTRTWQPFVPLALACAVPLLGLIGDGALHRAASRLGEAVGNGVSSAAFTILSIPVVMGPWLVRRVLRTNPPESDGPGWVTCEHRLRQPDKPWSTSPSKRTRGKNHPRPPKHSVACEHEETEETEGTDKTVEMGRWGR